MRLWSIHPQYLDAQGLVALWRETLLAQAVLSNETKGYRYHPQLDRFKQCSDPRAAVSQYLLAIYADSQERGYSFNKSKIKAASHQESISVTSSQLNHEWRHLLSKLKQRSPAVYEKWHNTIIIEPHSMFVVKPGDIEAWERL